LEALTFNFKIMAKEKNTTEEPVNNEHAGATQAYFDELAAKSAENRKAGASDVEIDLHSTHTVKFKKDFGFIKKDAVLTVSDTAYNIYNKAGAVEKV
jgi:hypothetical protein